MKLPRVRLALVLLFGIAYATPSFAQYMYLDTNGDGIHTSADQVNPTGPTVIDLWLDTDSNRDGSAAVCINGGGPFSMISYSFNLRAIGGTVSWGEFGNAIPDFGVRFRHGKTDTDLGDGYGGLSKQPGLYRLGKVQMSVASGSPSIQIVSGSGPADPTSFGSPCLGTEFDNTMTLGREWFDADGLPFGTDGDQNGAPVLAQPADMNLTVGELSSQTLAATDVDRQPLTFSMISGPRYAQVNTLDPGSGTAAGIVHLAPHVGDEARTSVVVEATDGALADRRTFAVEVVLGANHPPVWAAPRRIEVVAGAVRRVPIEGLDADGQTLTYSKVAGPDYMDVAGLFSGPAATAGSIRLAPDLCDAGGASAEVTATDGIATTEIPMEILVRTPARAPASPVNYLGNSFEEIVALRDLNSDGHLDAVVVDGRFLTIRSLSGKGDGSLTQVSSLSLGHGEPLGMATGDFNEDGHPDVVVTLSPDNVVRVLLGRGDGSFIEGQTLGPLSFPTGVTAADMNRDGDLDLMVANASGSAVSLFLGNGDGTFAPKRDIKFGPTQREVAVADFNRDGLPDFAASGFENGTVGVRLGFGDGTFGDLKTLSLGGGAAYAIIAGDWNWDGKPDIAVSDWSNGRVVTFLGDGAGGFAPGVVLSGFHTPQSLDSSDFNGDGISDLLVGDLSDAIVAGQAPTRILYGFGDGTFGNARPLSGVSMYDVASGDLNEDGFPDAVFVGAGLNVWFSDAAGAGAAQARAFSRLDNNRSFPFIAALAPECVRMEPVAGSYQNSDVNFRSIALSSEGTGSVSEIPAIFESRPPQRDFDRNGIAEIPVCFDRKDLDRLFDKLRGRRMVTAHLEGALTDGRRFCTPVDMDIAGYKRHFIVFLTPNPLNPQATLTYSTTTDGFVRIRVFDLSGRLVRTLVEQPMVPAGDHAVVIDGRNQSGARLASGIYFYQVEAQEGTVRGRMTVLK